MEEVFINQALDQESVKEITNRPSSQELVNKMRIAKTKLEAVHPSKRNKPYYKELKAMLSYLEQNRVINFSGNGVNGSSLALEMGESDETAAVIKCNRKAYLASKIVFGCNIVLFIAKIIACVYSKSISMVSSTLDSAVDILSSAITYFTNYKIKRLDIYKHPQGKTRMIPLSIIIISVIMSITSLQVITESFNRIVTGDGLVPEFSIIAICIVASTIVIKIALFFYCVTIHSPTSQLLSQDSRNDVLTNLAVLIGLLMSNCFWRYADGACAIFISSYVLFNWASTGISHLGLIIGKTARPSSLQLFGWVCILHAPEILYISTVRAYSFGNRYLLEVDIVLNEEMPLKRAHDIGETLQRKLESLPDVERAFVHLDFEKDHNPQLEHKIGKLF